MEDPAERWDRTPGGLRREEDRGPDSAARVASSTLADSSSSEAGGAERRSRDLPGLRAGQAVVISWQVLGSRDLLDSLTGLDRGWISVSSDSLGELAVPIKALLQADDCGLWLVNAVSEVLADPEMGSIGAVGVEIGTGSPVTSDVMRSRYVR